MPMHDWTTVEAGTYHTFHQAWAVMILAELNTRVLPSGYRAGLEGFVDRYESDLITFENNPGSDADSGTATLTKPKKTFVFTAETDLETAAMRANRVVVRTLRKKVVAVIEIVSPGNKKGRNALGKFLAKTVDFLSDRVSVLLIDPFPPNRLNPQGLHPLVWDHFAEEPFVLPKKKPLTFASYQVAPCLRAYVEPLAVRQALPDMPLFLNGEFYVNVPLEKTYMDTCAIIPADTRASY